MPQVSGVVVVAAASWAMVFVEVGSLAFDHVGLSLPALGSASIV